MVLASVTAAVSVSADVPAPEQDSGQAEMAGEWFYRAAGGSVYAWTFTDSGEFEWTVTHAGVSSIPTVLGRGNYEVEGGDQLVLVFVGKDGAAEAPQTRTWRICGGHADLVARRVRTELHQNARRDRRILPGVSTVTP